MFDQKPGPEGLSRRQLLSRMSAAALFLGAHGPVASGARRPAGGPSGEGRMPEPAAGGRILALRLETATPLTEMKAFYGDALGLPIVERRERELVVSAGATRITFVRTPSAAAAPFYHFAFNIPENKILAARAWQLERSELFITPPNLRDPDYPDDVRHFRSWNAHSVFFWDPAGNVVEYIARHDLNCAADGAFGTADILYASEIAFVVDDVPDAAREIQTRFDLPPYRPGSEVFSATGDERGLLLLFKRDREIGDVLRGRPAAADVFATGVEIRGAGARAFRFPGYPFEVSVSTSG